MLKEGLGGHHGVHCSCGLVRRHTEPASGCLFPHDPGKSLYLSELSFLSQNGDDVTSFTEFCGGSQSGAWNTRVLLVRSLEVIFICCEVTRRF